MSRSKTIGLAVIILIASAFLVAARDTSKTIEVANYPAITRDAEPQIAARARDAALRGTIAEMSVSVEASPRELPLAENAYDFNKIDSIPGFGTLPPTYDTKPVMPRIGGE
jgi:hypothetical protein